MVKTRIMKRRRVSVSNSLLVRLEIPDARFIASLIKAHIKANEGALKKREIKNLDLLVQEFKAKGNLQTITKK